MKNEITLNVVQGVGDIFWVYQKMSPYFDVINFNVSIVSKDMVQVRARDWVQALPKAGKVQFVAVERPTYNTLARQKCTMDEVMELASGPARNAGIDYCCNRWLEEGVRIEDIDPKYHVEWNIPFPIAEMPLNFKEYSVFYVSANVKSESAVAQGGWSMEQWIELFNLYQDHIDSSLPVVVIGALFDIDAIREIGAAMKARGTPCQQIVQASPSRVMHILTNSKYFIGLQSGLNILADNFDVKQLMIYYPCLEPMMYAWCKQKNIKTLFNAYLFTQTPAEVFEQAIASSSLPNA